VTPSVDETLPLADVSPAEARAGRFFKSSPFITTTVLLLLLSSGEELENFRKFGRASERFFPFLAFPVPPSSPMLGRECWYESLLFGCLGGRECSKMVEARLNLPCELGDFSSSL
jgi:hypothetical protein